MRPEVRPGQHSETLPPFFLCLNGIILLQILNNQILHRKHYHDKRSKTFPCNQIKSNKQYTFQAMFSILQATNIKANASVDSLLPPPPNSHALPHAFSSEAPFPGQANRLHTPHSAARSKDCRQRQQKHVTKVFPRSLRVPGRLGLGHAGQRPGAQAGAARRAEAEAARGCQLPFPAPRAAAPRPGRAAEPGPGPRPRPKGARALGASPRWAPP